MIKDLVTGEITNQEYEKSYLSGDTYVVDSGDDTFEKMWAEEFAENEQLLRDYDDYFA